MNTVEDDGAYFVGSILTQLPQDITSLISLISSLNSNNPNSTTNGVMNFFAQNQSAQKQN